MHVAARVAHGGDGLIERHQVGAVAVQRQSRRVARAIVAARPLETTGQLAQVVRKALGYRPHNNKGPAPKDPATRSFQAIRIHLNAELDELEQGLEAAFAYMDETLVPLFRKQMAKKKK